MASIIEQIQRDALDANVRVSDLLRRVKFAATKLGLGAVEDWVEQELSGYSDAVTLPEYRIINGRPMAQHPYRGWELIGGHVERISKRKVGQTIASLEELAKAPEGTTIHFPFSDAVLAKLNEANGTREWSAALEVDKSAIVSILDRVRTLVLDWALKMEQAGVVGTEFNFDAADKKKARGVTTTINIGNIGSFAGNLGTENTAGDITVNSLNTELVGDLAVQLKAQTNELIVAGADGAILKTRLDQIEEELKKPAPVPSVLRGLLVDVRSAIAGAAGNLVATGAIALINQIIGSGVPAP
jgi:hypothetical protein